MITDYYLPFAMFFMQHWGILGGNYNKFTIFWVCLTNLQFPELVGFSYPIHILVKVYIACRIESVELLDIIVYLFRQHTIGLPLFYNK